VINISTRIVYCDESGDDGLNTCSSTAFILTSLYMPAESWQENYNKIVEFRKQLKDLYGFHVKQEMHTKHLLTDKTPYKDYKWSDEQKRDIIREFTKMVSCLDISVVNVIIDKSNIKKSNYPVLVNALKYNIQRIENTSKGEWNYIIITDKGRLAPMRKTARVIRAYNPIPSKYCGSYNKPIEYLIEDILEKDSRESYFIQLCDFVSYFVHLYYKTRYQKENLPTRVGRLIDNDYVGSVLKTLSVNGVLNEKASTQKYGLVIYPKN
jgi:hypothetical protein